MKPRRRAGAATAWPVRVDGTDRSALRKQVETLEATCRRRDATIDALHEAVVKLHRANSALRAENAAMRRRNSVSMVERVRRTPRRRPRPLFNAGGTVS